MLKRSKNEVNQIGPYSLKCGEIEPAFIKTVELVQDTVEASLYREI